jgi:PKD repeat protein
LEKEKVLLRKTYPEMIALALFSIGMLTLAFNILCVKADSAFINVTYSQQVGGHISEDTIWTMESAPYIVVEDVIVESDVTLTVEPGVVVKFTSGRNLVIEGALVAEGNPTHPITFTGNSTTPKPGDWGSIKFRDSSDDDLCKITYGVIEYGTKAVSIESSATSILFCDISNNSENGVTDSKGSPTISGCSVYDNRRGILIEGASESVTVIDNNIANNSLEGILLKGAQGWLGPINISENTISFNGRDGVSCDVSRDVLILGNTISNNTGCGISSNRKDTLIRNNMIKGNDNGICFEYSHHDHVQKYPISYNHIYGNVLYDFYNSRRDSLDAPYNWWGTSNETVIRAHIYDHEDDHDVGRVFYEPYLVPPVAEFAFSPETLYPHGSVTFDASASFNSHGSIIDYTWDFDDGNVTAITSPLITHMYTTADDYNVSLTVTDEFGLTNSTSALVTVLRDDTAPETSDDYDGAWHTTDFTITLTVTDHESGVLETYYRINNGLESVSIDGQPLISLEGANNTLEYWSVDNVGNEEFPHKILTEIKLDKTAPTGSIIINNDEAYTASTSVTLTLTAEDTASGVAQMCFSHDNVTWTDWEAYSISRAWTLTTDDGTKTVYAQYRDNAGLISLSYQDTIILDTTKPIASAGPDQTVAEDTLVRFNGSASTDNIGIAGYTWTFTDVTVKTLTGETPAYTFTTPGVYTVTLNVTDADGNWATDTFVVTVMDITSPTANAGADQKVCEDTSVMFDASGSSDNVGIVSYEWDFGDGTTEEGKTPSHTYTAPGDYMVELTVKDAVGNIGTDTVIVTVLLDTDGDGTSDVIDTDDDDDGMPDRWETENGLNPLDAADGPLDPDGDGLTNLKEYQRGTNPTVSDAEALTTEAFALWVLGAAVAMIALAGALAFLWMKRK